MTNTFRFDAPYHWWGPGPAPSTPPALRDLVHNGTIDVECVAKLWAALAHHQSLTVIGGPSGLGKSTLLHTLLPALPERTHRVFLRGCYETFAFQDDPQYAPATSTLLANEISPHLPIYLWGPAVKRTLDAGLAGYQILATAHGRSVMEFAAALTGSPLRIPARTLAAIGLVALLEPAPDGAGRRVTELWQLSAARDGVSIERLGTNDLPAGVTDRQVAAARSTVLSMLGQDAAPPGPASPGTTEAEKRFRAIVRTATDLEQTPAGE
jgi:energy-coupling factor transporter ATP-binding protein EcfA2